MSQMKPSHLIFIMAIALALGGCGDKNDKAVFSPDSGHSSDWITAHKASAKADLETCVECHGASLDGGMSNVACTQCHPASADAVSKHPLAWGSYGYARHKAFVATNGTSSCANSACHGSTLTGGATGSSCATACHMGGATAKHPAVWLKYSSHGNYAKGYGVASCSTASCHGTDSKGVFLSGPSCYSCHPSGPSGKHPAEFINSTTGHFTHKQYVATNGSVSCNTSFCHGTGGTGPSCSTAGCH